MIILNYKKIEAFLKTVELGSMNKAAEYLNYSQPGLMYIIKSLENELGCKLLVRNPYGVTLTPEGREFMPFLEDLANAEKELWHNIQLLSTGTPEKLRVAAHYNFVRSRLPAVVSEFLEKYPDVDLHLQSGSQDELLSLLHKDEADIVIASPVDDGQYHFRPLYEDEIYVAIPKRYDHYGDGPLKIQELADIPLLIAGTNPFDRSVNDFLKQNLGIHNRLSVSSMDTTVLLQILENKNAVLFLSKEYLVECPSTVNMHPLNPPTTRTIGIITKNKSKLSKAGRAFIDICSRQVRKRQA